MARGTGAKLKNSRPYTVDGKVYSFTHDRSGKLIGVTSKGSNGKFNVAEDLNHPKFTTDAAQSAISNAYNIANYKGNKESYKTFSDVSYASIEERDKFLNDNKKKFANQSVIDKGDEDPIAPKQSATPAAPSGKTESMAYPLDLNFKQDHFKITKFNYVRPSVNQSKSQRQTLVGETGPGYGGKYRKNSRYSEQNVAGDGVINSSKPLGSIFLPMPKATDVNGVEWGKSELTISGLAALGGANLLTAGGKFLARTEEEMQNDKAARDLLVNRREIDGSGATEMGSALYTQAMSKLAGGVFGVELDADTVLARQGGRVLNPNAEMLFQGPVIRDFAFSFLMIARSQKEGDEIRKILRFLKLGMAPKYRTTTYLKAPDVFTLEYKNGKGKDDLLRTVNQFNPGGLALTTMNVDYAPNGYWSAYRDSQPVILKMDLNFTELRPIYEGDQAGTPEDSVGY